MSMHTCLPTHVCVTVSTCVCACIYYIDVCVPCTHMYVACVLTHMHTCELPEGSPRGSAVLTYEWGLYIGRGPSAGLLTSLLRSLLPRQTLPCLLTGWVLQKPLADSQAGRDCDISTNPLKGQGRRKGCCGQNEGMGEGRSPEGRGLALWKVAAVWGKGCGGFPGQMRAAGLAAWAREGQKVFLFSHRFVKFFPTSATHSHPTCLHARQAYFS